MRAPGRPPRGRSRRPREAVGAAVGGRPGGGAVGSAVRTTARRVLRGCQLRIARLGLLLGAAVFIASPRVLRWGDPALA